MLFQLMHGSLELFFQSPELLLCDFFLEKPHFYKFQLDIAKDISLYKLFYPKDL